MFFGRWPLLGRLFFKFLQGTVYEALLSAAVVAAAVAVAAGGLS